MLKKPRDAQTLDTLAMLQVYAGSGKQSALSVKDLLAGLMRLRRAAIQAQWKTVFLQASQSLGFGGAVLRRLQGDNWGDLLRLQRTKATVEKLEELLTGLVNSGHAGEVVAALRQQGQHEDADLLDEIEPALKLIAQGKKAGVKRMTEAVGPFDMPSRQLQLPSDAAIAAATRGLLGLVHAEYNVALKRIRVPKDGWPKFIDAFRYESLGFEAFLVDSQRRIYSALRRRSSTESLSRMGDARDALERNLPLFARTQARATLMIRVLLDTGKGTEAMQLGRLAARAGQLTREAIATQAAICRLTLDLSDPVVKGGALVGEAAELQFDTDLPNGKDVPISDLDQQVDGAFIEISGFIEQIRIARTRDKKLVGQFQLVDPATGSSGFAAARFVHPLHIGVTPGAFLRVSGKWRAKSTLRDEQKTVESDNLPLAELAARAWRISFLRSAERFYEPWRNQTNMCWSLGAHEKVMEDGAPLQGAAELIYLPFVRPRTATSVIFGGGDTTNGD